MNQNIQIRYDHERGCGRRKTGGLYLVCDEAGGSCGKLPIPLEVCPCCGGGFKPSRGLTWIDQPERLWRLYDCKRAGSNGCTTCPLSNAFETGAAILIWVGESYYKFPSDFIKESVLQGISRRIPQLPKRFKVGETWVMLAHRKAIPVTPPGSLLPEYHPGIFSMFLPTRVEMVVTGKESNEEIDNLVKRGITPVLIKRRKSSPPPDELPSQESFL